MNDPKIRERIERAVISVAVTDLLLAGYELRVDDGNETLPPRGTVDAIMSDLFSVDEEWIRVRPGDSTETDIPNSFVYLVHGNDGYDVISDHGTSIDGVLERAYSVADAIADGHLDLIIRDKHTKTPTALPTHYDPDEVETLVVAAFAVCANWVTSSLASAVNLLDEALKPFQGDEPEIDYTDDKTLAERHGTDERDEAAAAGG